MVDSQYVILNCTDDKVVHVHWNRNEVDLQTTTTSKTKKGSTALFPKVYLLEGIQTYPLYFKPSLKKIKTE